MDFGILEELAGQPGGAAPAPVQSAEAPGHDTMNDYGIDFSVYEAALQLQDHSPMTRLDAYLKAYGITVKLADFLESPKATSLKSFIKMCAVIGSIGSDGALDVPLGTLDHTVVDRISLQDNLTIRSSFKVVRGKGKMAFSSRSLPHALKVIAGAEISPWYTPEGNYAGNSLKVEHMNLRVWCGTSGRLSSIVQRGGQECADILSALRKVTVEYFAPHPTVYLLTDMILMKSIVSFADKTLSFVINDNKKWPMDIFGGSPNLDGAYKPIFTQWFKALNIKMEFVHEKYTGIKITEQSGLDLLGYLAWEGLSEGGKELMTRAVNSAMAVVDVAADFSSFVVDWTEGQTKDFFVPGKAGMGAAVVAGPPKNPRRLTTMEAVSKFVEKNRNVRQKQPERKTDGVSNMGFLGEDSSVPAKFALSQQFLSQHGALPPIKHVQAWGISKFNHWEQHMMSVAAKASASLSFHDVDRKWTANSPTSMTYHADVERLEPDSGKGMAIYDDTYVVTVPLVKPNGQQTESGQEGTPRCGPKLKSILAAGYEYGFVKLIYGYEDNVAVDNIFSVPKFLYDYTAKYHVVELHPGGTSHSPEYILAFAHKRVEGKDRPTLLRSPSTRPVLSTEEYTLKKWEVGIKGWLTTKAVDMIRANKYNTSIAITGISRGIYKPVMEMSRPGILTGTLRLSGQQVWSSDISARMVEAAANAADAGGGSGVETEEEEFVLG